VIGAKVVRHSRYLTFQIAEVAVSRQMFPDRPVAGPTPGGVRDAGVRCEKR